MSLSISVDGGAIVDAVTPSSVQATQMASDGEAGFGGFDIDDPGADILTVGHKPVVIEESECSQPRLFTGWTSTRDMGRSPEHGLLVADDRLHDVNIVDMNAAFRFRILRGSDTQRPEESMDDRLAWLLTKPALTAFIDDLGLVATGYSSTMDEADYRGQTPSAVLDDLIGRLLVDLTYFAYWDPDEEAVGLYFGPANTGTGESPLSISNVETDVDGSTVFAPYTESKLTRKPDEVYSQVILRYKDGTKRVYRERPATATAYVDRGTVIDRPRTKKLATARAQADGFLKRHSVEVDTITTTILVPPESAGLALAGQRIDVRFSHLPGYESWTSLLIVTSTVAPANDVANRYLITLELRSPRGGTPPEPEPVGFHQLILCNAQGGPAVVGGSYTTTWGGTAGAGGISLALPAVVQDTDGYTGTPGDLQDIEVTTWTIPEGLGGIYEVGWEMISALNVPGDDWWLSVPPVGSPNPQQVPYTYHGEGAGYGFTLLNATFPSVITQTLAGATGIGAQAIQQGGFWRPFLNLGPSSVHLAEGATLSFDTSFNIDYAIIVPPSTVHPFGAYYGPTLFGDQSALFIMRLVERDVDAEPENEDEDLGPTPQATTDHTSDPTPDDDAEDGYTVGSIWVNTVTGRSFILTDSTVGAAVWQLITTPDPITGIETVDPTVDDDGSEGYTIGSLWVNTTSGEVFVMVSDILGAAVWVSLTAPPALDDLSDVDTSGVADGDVLTFDSGSGTWVPVAPSVVGVVFNIVAVFDAGTEAITGNPEIDVVVPADGTITGWTLLADAIGSAEIDIYSDTYGNYPPTSGDSIVAAAPPELSSETKATDSTLTGWDTALTAGDVLRFHLSSSSTVKRLVLTLAYTRD